MTAHGRRPILCLDFDGVIHDYREGWQGGNIYGAPTPGFFAWAAKADLFFKLVVYSSRSKDQELRDAMIDWVNHRSREARSTVDFEFAHEKPPAFLTIDDRVLTFTGKWDDFDPAKMKSFQTWSEKKP